MTPPPAPPRRASPSTVRRLSLYLRALDTLAAEGVGTVSSQGLAERSGTTPAQVRKDLSLFGSFGRRGMGYEVPDLLHRVRAILGLDRRWPVALVGAGRIGSALFAYPLFRERGFEIRAVFDNDPAKIGSCREGLEVRPVTELPCLIRERGIEIGIITVPAHAAQAIATVLVESGVRGILNFAPTRLHLPPEIEVNEVSLSMELEALSFALAARERP